MRTSATNMLYLPELLRLPVASQYKSEPKDPSAQHQAGRTTNTWMVGRGVTFGGSATTTNLQDTGSHSTIYGRQEWTRAIGWWWLKGATIHRKQNTNEQKQNTTNYDKTKRNTKNYNYPQ